MMIVCLIFLLHPHRDPTLHSVVDGPACSRCNFENPPCSSTRGSVQGTWEDGCLASNVDLDHHKLGLALSREGVRLGVEIASGPLPT